MSAKVNINVFFVESSSLGAVQLKSLENQEGFERRRNIQNLDHTNEKKRGS